ncbi:MFS transporter [Roseivirga sp.]|uniref:MFS transporter n=1 Tax=Roseivirga sp. TaxID=1964215 RepID=UPI003B51E7BE
MKKIIEFIRDPGSRAVGLIFMSMSIVFGAWVTRLPELQLKLHMSEGRLGLALFAMPLGAILLLPFYTRILEHLGERKSTWLGLGLFLPLICITGLMPNFRALCLNLLLVGMAMGLTNISMNACATALEKKEKRSLMSACHGFFSLGGMVGSATSSMFIGLGLNSFYHILCWVVVLGICVTRSSGHLIDDDNRGKSKSEFLWPPKSVVSLALIGFCIMLGEGAITDWSTIYMKQSQAAPTTIASFGFAAFAGCMAIGRFFGDQLIESWGSLKMLLLGCLLGILGLLTIQLDGYLWALFGFGGVGLGFSVIVPTLISQSAKQRGIKPSAGITSVASSGYIGLLIGPVLIGFIAEHWGIDYGFTFITGLSVLAFLVVLLMRKSIVVH